jgi:hypothetical protein
MGITDDIKDAAELKVAESEYNLKKAGVKLSTVDVSKNTVLLMVFAGIFLVMFIYGFIVNEVRLMLPAILYSLVIQGWRSK